MWMRCRRYLLLFIYLFPGDPISYVTVRIHHGIIDGLYYTQDEVYYVEPSSRYFHQPVPFHSLVYKSTDVNFNLSNVKTKGYRTNYYSTAKLVSL